MILHAAAAVTAVYFTYIGGIVICPCLPDTCSCAAAALAVVAAALPERSFLLEPPPAVSRPNPSMLRVNTSYMLSVRSSKLQIVKALLHFSLIPNSYADYSITLIKPNKK